MHSSVPSAAPPHGLRSWLRTLAGPGLLLAATGVGASDWVTSTVNGGRFGYALLWVVVVGAFIKAVLNEGLARWQLVTGHTLLTGWRLHLPAWCRIAFLSYLLLWAMLLGGSLAAACGMAAQTILPLPLPTRQAVAVWGMVHLGIGAWAIAVLRYERFERIMSGLVLLMFATTIGAAGLTVADWRAIVPHLLPQWPDGGSTSSILSSIGGIGGSVSVLAYSYWLQDANRRGSAWIPATRVDLVISYLCTAVFNLSTMVIGAFALYPAADIAQRVDLVHDVTQHLQTTVGTLGVWLFLAGFWAAVVGSLLGCLHGIPYLAADLMRPAAQDVPHPPLRHSPWYRRVLLLLVLPPLVQLWVITPVTLVMLFTLLASLFTPLLAASLLYLNNHAGWMGVHRNRWGSNIVLVATLLLFVYLFGLDIWHAVR